MWLAPPSYTNATSTITDRLRKLKEMRRQSLIDDDEYAAAKGKIVQEMLG